MTGTKHLAATSRARRKSPPARVRITGIQGNVVAFASPGPAHDVWREQLGTVLGSTSDAFVDMALHHLERAARMPGDGASEMAINGAIAMIAAKAPMDEIETGLALQMACTHMAALAVMSRIGGAGGGPQRIPGLASASAKLLRAFFAQVETYRRLRGGGEQTITVQHVTLNNQGGQAIVGGVLSRPTGQ